ncbi:MAG: hypothetical protein IPH45_14205 [Bacteroidales bacterium]|nr:hypothetical protein [Bacteroidales bacterium]
MKKILTAILFFFIFIAFVSGQTAKEWNKQGIDHFKKWNTNRLLKVLPKPLS